MKAGSGARRGGLGRLFRWFSASRGRRSISSFTQSLVVFDADVISRMVRAAGVPCRTLHHRDDTVTIAAGDGDADGVHPILCRLDLTEAGWPRGADLHPGRATDDDDPPQDLLAVGCVTSRDVADLVVAYIVALAARPPGVPWELLDFDCLEHLGFDGTARSFSRTRRDRSRRVRTSSANTGFVYRWRLSCWSRRTSRIRM